MTKEQKRVTLQIFLFITTFFTTTLAGSEWLFGRSIFFPGYEWKDFAGGLWFSVPLLLILTVHEFGHYFTAMYHKVKTSLPYYIPIPPMFLPGTLGAVIRIRSKVYSNIQHFDIGLAGPLAGFIIALVILFYGFTHLPEPDYVFKFHPEYEQYGANYADHVYSDAYREEQLKQNKASIDVMIGKNLIFLFFEKFVADPARVPNVHEMMHYPILMAGFIALFITSLNLLPIGQLDGGHIVYGLFKKKGHEVIATTFFFLLLLYAGLGMINVHDPQEKTEIAFGLPVIMWKVIFTPVFYYICLSRLDVSKRNKLMYALLIFAVQLLASWFFPSLKGYSGWLIFAFLVGRVLGIQHPPSEIEVPLDNKRIVLGWVTLVIFILCFSPIPIEVR